MAAPQQLFLGIYRGADDSILKLKLGFLNLKILKYKSVEFNRSIDRIMPHAKPNFKDYERMFDEYGTDDRMFAFVPVDKDKLVTQDTFYHLQEILLIMFPSNFKLVGIAHYLDRIKKGVYMNKGFETWRYNVQPFDITYDYLLTLDFGRVKDINALIKLYFKRRSNLEPYLTVAFSSYIQAFTHMNPKMVYTNYFMAIDSLMDDNRETVHRTARICAVLNSSTVKDGKMIYKNFGKFYSLRSAVVHGGTPKRMKEYYLGIQALISRTLIELIQMNFPGKQEFNDAIITSGFGNKRRLQPKYRDYVINIEVSNLIKEEVVKYS